MVEQERLQSRCHVQIPDSEQVQFVGLSNRERAVR
jgi:hypothetical protein